MKLKKIIYNAKFEQRLCALPKEQKQLFLHLAKIGCIYEKEKLKKYESLLRNAENTIDDYRQEMLRIIYCWRLGKKLNTIKSCHQDIFYATYCQYMSSDSREEIQNLKQHISDTVQDARIFYRVIEVSQKLIWKTDQLFQALS